MVEKASDNDVSSSSETVSTVTRFGKVAANGAFGTTLVGYVSEGLNCRQQPQYLPPSLPSWPSWHQQNSALHQVDEAFGVQEQELLLGLHLQDESYCPVHVHEPTDRLGVACDDGQPERDYRAKLEEAEAS